MRNILQSIGQLLTTNYVVKNLNSAEVRHQAVKYYDICIKGRESSERLNDLSKFM